ncbi:hypothetical protein Sjap_005237 [Stephania japonica]|uniref:Uncharacterized protein n=1 Tax=Stephania japonica TaxID=461633 RepID=A0AAP0K541_9MAGN
MDKSTISDLDRYNFVGTPTMWRLGDGSVDFGCGGNGGSVAIRISCGAGSSFGDYGVGYGGCSGGSDCRLMQRRLKGWAGLAVHVSFSRGSSSTVAR